MQGGGTERDSQADCELSALREVGSAVGLDTWFCEGPGPAPLMSAEAGARGAPSAMAFLAHTEVSQQPYNFSNHSEA